MLGVLNFFNKLVSGIIRGKALSESKLIGVKQVSFLEFEIQSLKKDLFKDFSNVCMKDYRSIGWEMSGF